MSIRLVSRERCYVYVCAHGARFPRPIASPAARSALATRMLTGSALRAGEMFPVTRELQLVSMSVGPRYSRAVLVK